MSVATHLIWEWLATTSYEGKSIILVQLQYPSPTLIGKEHRGYQFHKLKF